MSLRLKILSILAVACLLGDALLILIWHPWQTRTLTERERETQLHHLVTLGDAITPFLLQNQIGAIYEVLDATLERQPEWKRLTLKDENGAVLYPLDTATGSIAGDLLYLEHSITLRNQTIGQIELISDLAPILAAEAQKTRVFVIIITAGFILTAGLIALLMHILFGQRIQNLMVASERMRTGDYAAPLPLDTHDEIGQLAQAFDAMRSAIAANESSLREAQKAAEASSRAKSTFLATMSHEIRTPMNGILGMAQLLQMPDFSEDERQEFVRTILSSGESLLSLLNDILDLSKMEAGRLEFNSDLFAPEELLTEVATLFRNMAAEQGLEIETHWQGASSVFYRADVNRLRQMLSNLVSNAIKFSEQGTVRLLAAAGKPSDGHHATLTFSVTDYGIGISEDKREKLFQPFSQVDGSETRKYAGTGLGLSIVRSLAQQMGGTVGVESTPGRGSTFWFTISALLEADLAQAEAITEPAQLPPILTENTGMQDTVPVRPYILIVEDNATNQLLARLLVEREGFNVTCVGNGEEALAALAPGHHFALVLMDCQMPVLDGFAATIRLRAEEAATGRPRIPVIALSASAFEDDRTACTAAGMDDFLAKPLLRAALRRMLDKWLPEAKTNASAPPVTSALLPGGQNITTSIRQLLPLLSEQRFDAIDRFAELEAQCAGTALSGTLAALRTDLHAFNYRNVQAALEKLLTDIPDSESPP